MRQFPQSRWHCAELISTQVYCFQLPQRPDLLRDPLQSEIRKIKVLPAALASLLESLPQLLIRTSHNIVPFRCQLPRKYQIRRTNPTKIFTGEALLDS